MTTGPAPRAWTASFSISTPHGLQRGAQLPPQLARQFPRARGTERGGAARPPSHEHDLGELLPELRADEAYREAFVTVYGERPRAGTGAGCACDLPALADHAQCALRPSPARGARCHHATGRARLPAVQGLSAASPAIRASTSAAICFSGSASFTTRSRRRPIRTADLGRSPSPARRMTGLSSAFRACATWPSRLPISTMAGPRPWSRRSRRWQEASSAGC